METTNYIDINQKRINDQHESLRACSIAHFCRQPDGSYRWPISDECILMLLSNGFCHWRVTDIATDVFHGDTLEEAIDFNLPQRRWA